MMSDSVRVIFERDGLDYVAEVLFTDPDDLKSAEISDVAPDGHVFDICQACLTDEEVRHILSDAIVRRYDDQVAAAELARDRDDAIAEDLADAKRRGE